MGDPTSHALPREAYQAGRDGAILLGPGFGEQGRWIALSCPQDELSLRAADIASAPAGEVLASITAFAQNIPPGGAVAGYLSYELASVLEPSLALPRRPAPCRWCIWRGLRMCVL